MVPGRHITRVYHRILRGYYPGIPQGVPLVYHRVYKGVPLVYIGCT